MRTILITGKIASGKSKVCSHLRRRGFDVYDSDARTKALYDEVPGLKAAVEDLLGVPFREISVIFSDRGKRERLEKLVYPYVLKDFELWRKAKGDATVFFESAVAMDKPQFSGIFDEVWAVEAPLALRLSRNPKVAERDALQGEITGADLTISNDGDLQALYGKIDEILKYKGLL